LGALLLGLLAMGLIGGWQLRDLSVAEQQGNPPTSTLPSLGGDNTESTREAVVAKVRPSVVQINVATTRGNGLGSGVVIDKRGYIVTNNHVVEGAQRLQVMMANGTALPAQLVGTAPMDDLAVVKIDPRKTDLTVASPGDSSNLKVGQTVLAIGNPLGITQTVTSGIVSALDRNVTNPSGDILPGTIQTDAPINPGNSGGALVDLQGNLVGIPTLVPIDPQFKTPANGVGFAIPVNRVKFITPQLINSGHVTNTGRAALGIQAATIDPVLAAQNNLPVDHGVLVADVTPGGAADRAGMRSGDIIVQIDNTPIDGASTLSDVLIQKKPGDVVKVQVYRGSQQMTVNVKLGVLSAP
ncbi:MAG: trypsin-like peptidase domain-containing protein, partial [Ktedonobacteraceae bacterium]|nr:trypsin-like peptidase domain-containing protein [Ktedonobacteraceae bacterium]